MSVKHMFINLFAGREQLELRQAVPHRANESALDILAEQPASLDNALHGLMLAVAYELPEDALRLEELRANELLGLLQRGLLVCVYVK